MHSLLSWPRRFVNFCSASAKTCKDLAPAWDEVGKELLQEQLFLTTVDAHSSPQLRQRFGIATLPTLILFRDRKVGACVGWVGVGVGG